MTLSFQTFNSKCGSWNYIYITIAVIKYGWHVY